MCYSCINIAYIHLALVQCVKPKLRRRVMMESAQDKLNAHYAKLAGAYDRVYTTNPVSSSGKAGYTVSI